MTPNLTTEMWLSNLLHNESVSLRRLDESVEPDSTVLQNRVVPSSLTTVEVRETGSLDNSHERNIDSSLE